MVDVFNSTHARKTLNQIKSSISAAKEENNCLATLKDLLVALFGDHQGVKNSTNFAFDSPTRKLLLTNFYSDFCSILLGLAASPWFPRFLKIDKQDLYSSFFLTGNPSDVLIALSESLKKSSHSFVIRCSISLLEKFLENGRLAELLFDQAKVLPTIKGSKSLQYSTATQIYWDELIRRIISLPDRASNVFKLSDGSQLWPVNFYRILGNAIAKALYKIQDCLAESKDCSLGFVSQIFSHVCVQHHGHELYLVLLPELQKMMSKSPLGCRICQKLFSLVQDSHLESVLEPLLLTNTSYKFLFDLLGDISTPENHKLRFLMTHKFLLHRFYTKDSIPYCIIGYLAESRLDPKRVLLETTHKLLEIWGNSSALKHRPYEQHLYITKCILLSLGFLNQESGKEMNSKVMELKTSLISKLLDTLPPHLQCPIEKIRKLGMIVAEEITRIVPHKGIQPLKFEFQRDEESLYLASLAADPSKALEKTNVHELLEPDQEPSQSSEISSPKREEKAPRKESENSELDSDDDLEPYPMDEEDDDVVNGVRPPVYLRDCISGLLSKDDPSRLEACLLVAEKLIRREQAALPEAVVELVKILLYLQDNYDTSNFYLLRHGAMVAAAVKCPKLIASYLTTEFYKENFNLRQRIDMLEVISAAAQELSQPIESNAKDLQKHLPLPVIPGRKPVKEKPNWQVIVEERIKSKTRIISHGKSRPDPKAVQNRFSAVAGDFFFPLLKDFDSKLNTFDLLGEDSLVLGKFIHTLGNVMQAIAGLNITRLMAKAMLDFIWSIRFHREPFIRQALLYGLCMTVLACPSHILITELNSDLLECHSWVQDVASNDADTDCKKIAIQTLLLINSVMKNFTNAEQ